MDLYVLVDGETRLATNDEIAEIEGRASVKVVPSSVTRRQARQALLLAGLLDQVPDKIAAIPNEMHRRLAEIEWQDSLEFFRNRPLVVQIAAELGLDSDALDDLFIQAASL